MPTTISARPRIYIDKVHFKGFKSIEDINIDFKKSLNILIGKNGSGKSNFMEFIFQAIRSSRNKKPVYNYAKVDFSSDDNHLFSIEFEKILNDLNIEGEDLEDSMDLFDNRITLIEKFTIDKKIVFDSSTKDVKRYFEFNNNTHRYRSSFRTLFSSLGYQPINVRYIRFNLPNNLECIDLPGALKVDLDLPFFEWEYPKTLSFITDILYDIELSYDESNKSKTITKSNIIKRLKVNDQITTSLKKYTPIEDVRFSNNINIYSDDKKIIIENIKIDFKLNGSWLPWSQLSDGTRRLFYIVAEITNFKGVVLIEEPELGVHPHQFNLLMDFLERQSEEKQIIISTHSPKALDQLDTDELENILITKYDVKKGTKIKHLTLQQKTKAKAYMKEVGFLSDYWMLSDLE